MKYIYIFITSIILLACNSTEYNNKNCSIEKQKSFVYSYMQDNYLWNKALPQVDIQAYDSAQTLLEALKMPWDKWSFIVSKEALDAYYSGLGYVGLGFKLKYFNNKLYIALVYPNSPAARAHLKRGDKIIAINNHTVANKDYAYINSLLGYDQEGVEVTLLVEDQNGTQRDLRLYKEQVHTPSVLKSQIFTLDGEKIGYILFDSFINNSSLELQEAFRKFKQNGIKKIIIDLRYNGGGLVEAANDFVSLLIGQNYSNEVSFRLLFNEENSYKNRNYYIRHLSNSMALDDIYFLTTKRTCSASEALINALKPYNVNTHIIGSKTCGKPVGMIGKEFCDFYLMPIEFKITNANQEGDYFNGLDVECQAYDDVRYDFATANETMFQEALSLIKNGVCSRTKNAKMIQSLSKEPKLEALRELNGGAF